MLLFIIPVYPCLVKHFFLFENIFIAIFAFLGYNGKGINDERETFMKDFIKLCYIITAKLIFFCFNLSPKKKKKVTFLISFPENATYIYEEMLRQEVKWQVCFLCHPRCYETFKKMGVDTYYVETARLWDTLVGLYHLATSQMVICDNYFGILAATPFKDTVKVVQIWHSAGTLKSFGLGDRSLDFRSAAAQRRFFSVYDRFTHYAVSSPLMADMFKLYYAADNATFLPTGVARTDFFFDTDAHNTVKGQFYAQYPQFSGKTMILYAPTFRTNGQMPILDVAELAKTLKETHVLLIKHHPAVATKVNLAGFEDFAMDVSAHKINELLVVTDILVTDYSSIPMEFCLLQRSMVFFVPDLEDYKESNGFYRPFEVAIPGYFVKDTTQLAQVIEAEPENFSPNTMKGYADVWATYCKGNSSAALVRELF